MNLHMAIQAGTTCIEDADTDAARLLLPQIAGYRTVGHGGAGHSQTRRMFVGVALLA